MRGTGRTSWAVVALAVLPGAVLALGCQSGAPRRVAAAEPGLSAPVEPGSSAAAAPGGGSGAVAVAPHSDVGWVDRHPLFSRPRDYYETTPSNKVVKAAAATVIGIPAGIFGEIKQIVTGAPTEPRY
jgi:hypothetical protein